MPTPSTISITLNNVDITNKVLYKETSFNAGANPVQGTFKVVVKDLDHDFEPVAGKKIRLYIDGVPLFGGYVMKIGRGFFFPAEDTSNPANVARKWTLEGPDFNLIFDKRVLYDASNPYSALEVPAGKRTISKAFTYMMNNFIDIPLNLDYTTHVDVIDTEYGTEEDGSLYVGQGKTLREQMDDFMDHGAVMYYIDADFAVHLHEYESLKVGWLMTDKPTTANTVGFREGTYHQDFGQLVTDALVWGGSTIRESDGGPGGDIVFARYPDPPAADATWSGKLQSAEREQAAIDRQNLYGKWQLGEERAGQENYKMLSSVKTRAFAIINGPPGAVPTDGIESGFSKPMETMSCTWFAHDVPNGNHVRPGYLMNFVLYTQGTNENGIKVTTLPLRSMRISFPTLPGSSPGDTYVRFDGDFGVSFSDRRYLWKALKRRKNWLRNRTAVVVADTSTSSAIPPGSILTAYAIETPDGSRTAFTFPYTFYTGWFDVYINGLPQRLAYDYTYDPDLRQVTFGTAPGVGDVIKAQGYGGT